MSEGKKTTIAFGDDLLRMESERIDDFHKWAAKRGGVQCKLIGPYNIISMMPEFDRRLFGRDGYGIQFMDHCRAFPYPEFYQTEDLAEHVLNVTHAIGLMTAQIQMMLEKPSKINVTTDVRENYTVVRRSCDKGEAEEKKPEQPKAPVVPDDKPAEPFNPGDVVRHKGGDTNMVVIALRTDNKNHVLIGLPVNFSVVCRWIHDGEVRRECFSSCELSKIG